MPGGSTPQTQGGMSSTNQSQTSNTSGTTGPNQTIAPSLQGLVQQIMSGYNSTPGGNPAVWTPAAESAAQTAFQRGSSGMDYGLNGAYKGYAGDVLNGKYLDLNSNPYFQDAMTASLKPATENFTQNVLPGIQSTFAGAGRPGAGNAQQQIEQAGLNFDRASTDAVTQAGNQAYQFERGQQGNTLGMMPALNNIDWQNIAGMTGGANAIQGNAQTQATAPMDFAAKIAAMLQSAYPGGQTQSNGTSTGTGTTQSMSSATPSSNAAGSGIGAGLSTIGMILPFLPGFGASDERIKKNIKPVGKSFTGHNLYQYEFLGSDVPQVGVLAQEVEKKDPDAVITLPGGIKAVNYNRVMSTPVGGLL